MSWPTGPFSVPKDDAEPFLEALLNQPIPFHLPPSLVWQTADAIPSAKADLAPDRRGGPGRARYLVQLRFFYGQRSVAFAAPQTFLASGEEKKLYARNRAEETRIFARLPLNLLSSAKNDDGADAFWVGAGDLFAFVQGALEARIPVTVENQKIQEAREFNIAVSVWRRLVRRQRPSRF